MLAREAHNTERYTGRETEIQKEQNIVWPHLYVKYFLEKENKPNIQDRSAPVANKGVEIGKETRQYKSKHKSSRYVE